VNIDMGGGIDTLYRRLPGKGSRKGDLIGALFSRCFLYLGPDHLLAVDNHGFSEDYRRFFFPDIQAIITRRTRRGAAWSVALALMTALSLTGALFPERGMVRIFFWALSGGLFLSFVVNLIRGPTCVCHILTAVQEEQLPSLNRLRVAQKVIGILRPAIEKAQAASGTAELNLDQEERLPPSLPSSRQLRRVGAKAVEVRHYDGAMHMIAFAFILADGILMGISLFYHHQAITIGSYAAGMAYSIFIVIALAKQYNSDIPGAVRKIAWASLGFICVSSFLMYTIMATTLVVHRMREGITETDIYRAMLQISPQDSPFLMAVYGFSSACALILGALGLLRVKRHRDHYSQPLTIEEPAEAPEDGGEKTGPISSL
jgi:hypothetical protein